MQRVMEIQEIHFKIILLTWFWVNFEPLQNPIRNIFKGKYLLGLWTLNLLSCWKCITLWSSIIILGREKWFEALILSFSVYVIDIILSKWQKN